MKRLLAVSLLASLTTSWAAESRADEKDAKAVVDKAIKALGGEGKLAKAGTHTTKAKGTITFNGEDHDIKTQTTVQGLDHFRSEFEGEFGGNTVQGVTVLKGSKGWRKFGENNMEMDDDGVANEKRTVYLAVIPSTLLPLKGKGFKIEPADEEKVGDKPAVGIKVTAPDGKDFKLYFDKESGLPVKLVAKVIGFQGDEFTMETTYAGYKDFDGIKKATKLESKRDGEKFVSQEVSEFKVMDKCPPIRSMSPSDWVQSPGVRVDDVFGTDIGRLPAENLKGQ